MEDPNKSKKKSLKDIDWGKTAVLELIQLWELYPCLYNPTDKFYNNKHQRAEALLVINENLLHLLPELEVNDIKQKMSSLRSQFVQENNKIEKSKVSGSGTEDIYEPSVYWFEFLLFLQKFVKKRKSKNSLIEETIHETENDITSVSCEEIICSEETPFSEITDCAINVPKNRKRKRDENDDPQNQYLQGVNSSLKTMTNVITKLVEESAKDGNFTHEEKAFGEQVMVEYKALTESNKLEARHFIFNKLFELRKQQLEKLA